MGAPQQPRLPHRTSSAEPSTPQCPQPIFPTNPRPLTSSVFPTNPRPTPASTALTTGTPSSPPIRPQPLSPQARKPLPRTSPQASPLITQPHHLLLSFSHSLPLKENPHEEQQLLFLLPLHQGISTLCPCCLPSVAATQPPQHSTSPSLPLCSLQKARSSNTSVADRKSVV